MGAEGGRGFESGSRHLKIKKKTADTHQKPENPIRDAVSNETCDLSMASLRQGV